MSARTTLRPTTVIAAGDMSAATITSTPTVLQSLNQASYAVKWAGTSPVGTLSLQVSNDYALAPDGTVAAAGTWNSVPLDVSGTVATTIPVSGNTGNGFIDITDTSAYAVRLLYTKASGVGTLSAVITGKVS